MRVGGTASTKRTRLLTGSGGFAVGGAASSGTAFTGTGGFTVSGAATQARGRTLLITSQAVRVGGTAGVSRTCILTGTSGATVGGHSDIVRMVRLDATSGVTLSGTGNIQTHRVLVGTGGVVLDGTADITYEFHFAGSGGFAVSGSAGYQSDVIRQSESISIPWRSPSALALPGPVTRQGEVATSSWVVPTTTGRRVRSAVKKFRM